MPFSRPLLPDLINRTRNDVISRLSNPDILRRSDAEVYTQALAGVAHALYGYLDWLSTQLIYDTAETAMLERWASIWGITRNPATQAIGTVTFTGSAGAVIPLGTILTAFDNVWYETTSEVIFTGTTIAAPIVAVGTGLSGTRTAGQTLTLLSPIAGVQNTAIATALTGGSDIESDDALRTRFLTRVKQSPQGGSKADYVNWALGITGVTRAWCYPLEGGAGTVTVRFMMDNTYSNGIPLSGDITNVSNALAILKPVTANLTVAAPIAVPLNFTISGLNPSTADVKLAITQSLSALITQEASPGGTIYLSHIREAISIAYGEVDHVLISPSTNVVNTTGNISTMGTITWA
ncbi:MAG: baseplate J/gp47 family protein [Methylococcales bacterium]|nr:baseplate J/gp47 family protein [Methylococcales bacterium]